MIENPISFDKCDTREELDELLIAFFGDRHFYLETGADDKIPSSGGFHASIREARAKASSATGKKLVELMRRCYPANMVRFSGFEKFNSKWWIALVDLVDPTSVIGASGLERVKEKHRVLLTGWTNKTHGSKAIPINVASTTQIKYVKAVNAQYNARIEEKTNKGYELTWGLEPDEDHYDVLDLKPPADILPTIPGLGKPKPRKKEPLLTTAPLEPKPEPKPAAPPKKAPPKKKPKVEAKEEPIKKAPPKKKAVKKKPKKENKEAKALKEKMRKRKRSSEW